MEAATRQPRVAVVIRALRFGAQCSHVPPQSGVVGAAVTTGYRPASAGGPSCHDSSHKRNATRSWRTDKNVVTWQHCGHRKLQTPL